MKKLMIICKKEIAFYLNNPVGYIIAALFACFANFLFIKDLFLRGNSSMRPFFDILPWLLIIFISAVTMRSFAEEKRLNTIEVLMTLPVSELVVVLAKFLSILIFSILTLLLTISVPVTLALISVLALPEIIVSYLGVLFLAGSYISIALFVSCSTKNQVIAFLISAVALFFYTLLGSEFLLSLFPSFFRQLIIPLSPLVHFETFLKGVVDVRGVFYFFSTTIMFLFFTVISLERKR